MTSGSMSGMAGVGQGSRPLSSSNRGGDHLPSILMRRLRTSARTPKLLLLRTFYSTNVYVVLTFALIFATSCVRLTNASVNFSITATGYSCSSILICMGGAHVYNGSTINGSTNNGIQDGTLSLIQEASYEEAVDQVGLAYFKSPIQLANFSSRQSASFMTSFTINQAYGIYIGNETDNGSFILGDGMAFVMSGSNTSVGTGGAYLGIFDDAGGTTFKSIVVEFDTYRNRPSPMFDISGSHVSFDFQNITTPAAANTSDVSVDLTSLLTTYAWVKYTSETKLLEVSVSHGDSRPTSSLLNYTVDLLDVVEEYMWVGFSSGSGDAYSNFYIGDWKFESYGLDVPSSLGDISPPPPFISLGPITRSSPGPVAPSSPGPIAPSSPGPVAPSGPGLVAPYGPGPVALSSPIPKVGKSGGNKVVVIVGISVGASVVCVFFLSACILAALLVRRSSRGGSIGSEDAMMQIEGMPNRFSYEQLSVATRAFSEEAKLGQGGFGSVYRGVLPSNGTLIAVKKISGDSNQGEKEFMTEVSIISQLRHRNLIQLQGWCKDTTRGSKYLLVYELMPNGSLDKVLFGSETDCLTWPQRLDIVRGTAAALEYLHQGWKQQVIHRDIKPSNIMLDANWNAKLGDFGLARLVDHQKEATTTVMAGTYGYIAPEVAISGRFTDKTDVYAFGAVLLEVACGRKVLSNCVPEDGMGLVDLVWRRLSEDNLMSTVDVRLGSEYDPHWMEVVLTIGLLCSHPDPMERPSMRHVVQVLRGDVPIPFIPASKPALVGPLKVKLSMSEGNSASRSGSIPLVSLDKSDSFKEDSAKADSSKADSSKEDSFKGNSFRGLKVGLSTEL